MLLIQGKSGQLHLDFQTISLSDHAISTENGPLSQGFGGAEETIAEGRLQPDRRELSLRSAAKQIHSQQLRQRRDLRKR